MSLLGTSVIVGAVYGGWEGQLLFHLVLPSFALRSRFSWNWKTFAKKGPIGEPIATLSAFI